RCTNGGGEATADTTITVVAAPVAPSLTTLVATPSTVVIGTATPVTWTWTYANAPTPMPDCSLDQGIGSIANGATTNLTLASATTSTRPATNPAGSDSKQVVIDTSPVPIAPVLATFTASPGSITANTPTNVTWSWTYSNSPTPAPACSIDNGVGT